MGCTLYVIKFHTYHSIKEYTKNIQQIQVNCDRKKRSILKPPRYNDTVASGDDYIM